MDIYLARTQGFCAGVSYAIQIVERAIEAFGLPIYVYHEIVHNSFVVDDFRRRGVVFVEDLQAVPPGSHLIFSAHGVPPAVIEQAKKLKLKYVDATCPLVKKVHNEAIRYSASGLETVLIGHRGHQEMIGTSGYVAADLLHVVEKETDIDQLDIDPQATVAYLTQTTLSVDESARMIAKLQARFPHIIDPKKDDICYATQSRQNAVKELAKNCDIIIICGSPNSSNSNRLRETGQSCGVSSLIIDSVKDLDFELLADKQKVGISSGASVPRWIVDELMSAIIQHYPGTKVITRDDPERNIVFPLPQIR